MYNNNSYSKGRKTLSSSASMKDYDKIYKIQESLKEEEISDEELSEGLDKIYNQWLAKNPNALNEYQEIGYWGVSPWKWTEGISLKGFPFGGVLKPLKWLAIPLLGGLGLLLAGLFKLLKEGKKQLAIARLRNWIKRLVVIADSGYKKTRYAKDSLFLIRQRYRRDILQDGVKLLTAAGVDVEEKHDKPREVETSLNESQDQNQDGDFEILSDTFTNINNPDESAVYFKHNGNTYLFINRGGFSTELKQVELDDNGIITSSSIPSDREFVESFYKKRPTIMLKNVKKGDILDSSLIKKEDINNTEDSYQPEPEIQEDPEDSSFSTTPRSGNISVSPYSDTEVPDDSRIDWSLMDTLSKRNFFGLNKKSTNFWKEAKSVQVVDNSDPMKFATQMIGLVSASLSEIANESVSNAYVKFMNQVIEHAQGEQVEDVDSQGGYNRAETLNYSPGIRESGNTQYDSMLKKLFEDQEEIKDSNGNIYEDPKVGKFLEHPNNKKFKQYLRSKVGMDYLSYNVAELQAWQNTMMQEDPAFFGYNDKRTNWDKILKTKEVSVSNYQQAFLKILQTNQFSSWKTYQRGQKDMQAFLAGLTKMVHVMIDAVAKKAKEVTGGQSNLVNALLSDKGDPKQNASLSNLWDNLGYRKLIARVPVHLTEIYFSPEMQWYLEVVLNSVTKQVLDRLGQSSRTQTIQDR